MSAEPSPEDEGSSVECSPLPSESSQSLFGGSSRVTVIEMNPVGLAAACRVAFQGNCAIYRAAIIIIIIIVN